MKYTAILKDKIIITDDYEDKELKTLIKNLSDDLNELEVDYPVDVMNEKNKKVLTLFPVA
jgi:hypothetical protein